MIPFLEAACIRQMYQEPDSGGTFYSDGDFSSSLACKKKATYHAELI